MGNLFGHKRWYEVEKIIKDKEVKVEVRIKRKYLANESKYVLNIDKQKEEYDENKITNKEFVDQFIEYKTKNDVFKKFTKKFHMGNILFKLKAKELTEKTIKEIRNYNDFLEKEKAILEIEIYQQSEKLREEENITKKDIIDKAIKEKITEDSNEIKMQIKSKENKSKEIKISINKETEEYHIKLKSINNDELNLKREIYEILKSINANLYIITKNAISNTDFKKRNYENFLRENIMEHLKKNIRKKSKMTFLKSLSNSLKKIQGNIKENDEIINFIKYYSNINGSKTVSENKKNFLEKILNTEVSVSENDIIDFIIGELKFYGIIKRIEKLQEKTATRTDEDIKNTYIDTYVSLDKHEKFKKYNRNKKDEIVKLFVKDINNNTMEEKINQILSKFKIEELIGELKKNTENKNFDTEIFGIFKTHYQKIFSSEKFENKSDEEKELYKIIYRYLKGRIEKILINGEKVRLKKMEKIEVKKIFNESILSEKILKRVKQYTLEYVMYLGKLVHNDIDRSIVNTNNFSRLHAREELDLELITFFASTNMELNKIFSRKDEYEENTDFFGEGAFSNKKREKITLNKKSLNSKIKMIRELDFIDNKNEIIQKNFFDKFIKIGANERNRILHASNKRRIPQGTQDDYNKVINIIQNLKISDEEASKALNLDVVFKDKKNIITKINDIKISEENNSIIKYLPSFSKVLPEILNLYKNENKNNPFDTIETEKIIQNALIYVNKELYKKLISEKNLEENESKNKFLKELKKNLSGTDETDENIIENYYKNAQISASKGNNKAIKKYQKKVIECYIGYLRKNYEELFDFSDFKMNIQEIKKQIKDINDNKTYERITIKTIDKTIVINDDFEYIISIFALLNSNAVINKIRNRFFATSVWLNTSEYQNIINILDEIMQLNTLRNECITENWNLNLEEFIQKMKEIEKDFDDFKIQTKKDIFNDNYESIKNNVLSKFIGFSDVQKILEEKLNKLIDFENDNEIKKSVNSDSLDSDERRNLMPNINPKKGGIDLIREIDELIVIEKNNTEKNILLKIIFNSNFLEKYKKEIDNLIEGTESENENKFEKIYYPEEHKNELYIYKKNLFLNIGNPNFDKIYGLISNDIKMADAKFLFNSDGKNIRNNKIVEIDVILKKLNNKLNGYSKEYKEKYVEKLKEDNDFFIKNIQNKNYKSFKRFEENYNKVSKYKKIRDLVEFNYLNKIESYLIDINWKLAIQMARFERDMHYIVNGLNYLYIIRLEREINQDWSSPYPKYKYIDKGDKTKGRELDYSTSYYNFKDYQKFVDICSKFGIDLSENSEINKPESESIRNYISHFYIVRNPFIDYSIAEQIDRVSDLLSYSTRYNNSTYASVFEVFKKDVDLEYDELKKKFKLISNTDILKRLMKPKKVSVLELESYNSNYIKNLIIELLTKVENKDEISS